MQQDVVVSELLVLVPTAAEGGRTRTLRDLGIRAEAMSPEGLDNVLEEAGQDACVFFMDFTHAYGRHYISDALLALNYSNRNASAIGRHFVVEKPSHSVRLTESGGEAGFVQDYAFLPTLVCHAPFARGAVLQAFLSGSLEILSISCFLRAPFEFVARGSIGEAAHYAESAFT